MVPLKLALVVVRLTSVLNLLSPQLLPPKFPLLVVDELHVRIRQFLGRGQLDRTFDPNVVLTACLRTVSCSLPDAVNGQSLVLTLSVP